MMKNDTPMWVLALLGFVDVVTFFGILWLLFQIP